MQGRGAAIAGHDRGDRNGPGDTGTRRSRSHLGERSSSMQRRSEAAHSGSPMPDLLRRLSQESAEFAGRLAAVAYWAVGIASKGVRMPRRSKISRAKPCQLVVPLDV